MFLKPDLNENKHIIKPSMVLNLTLGLTTALVLIIGYYPPL